MCIRDRDRPARLGEIATFLSDDTPCAADAGRGFDYGANAAPGTFSVRAHPDPMSTYVVNWDAVVETLLGTRYERFLGEDGSRVPDTWRPGWLPDPAPCETTSSSPAYLCQGGVLVPNLETWFDPPEWLQRKKAFEAKFPRGRFASYPGTPHER